MTLEKPRIQAPPAEPAEAAQDEPAKKSPPLNIPALLAGAATAATMAVIGGHLSVVGTVLGAALTSLVSGIAVAVYSASIERSRRGLKLARTVVSQRVLTRDGADLSQARGSTAVTVPGGRRWSALRPRLKPFLLSTGVIIGLAVGAIFGIQALTGTELSSGTGTIQRSVTGQESVTVRSAGVIAPGTEVAPATEVAPGTGVAPLEGTDPTAEAPTAEPTAATGVEPTSGAVADGGTTTTGDALPDAGGGQSGTGQTTTDGGGLSSGASGQQDATGSDTGTAQTAP